MIDVTSNPTLQFKVHYHGWKAKWDEWVPSGRLRVFDDPNKKKKETMDAELKDRVDAERRSRRAKRRYESRKCSSRQRGNAAASSSKRPKKMKTTDDSNENVSETDVSSANVPGLTSKTTATISEDVSPPPPAERMKLKIPFKLQQQLVVDWENVQKRRLVPLPRTPSVADVLEHWAAKQRRKKHTPTAIKAIRTLVDGLLQFFNDALPRCLLYRFERQQFETEREKRVRSAGKRSKRSAQVFDPSAVYGAEHLLRLFVKMPALLEEAEISEEDRAYFEPHMKEILKFLQKSISSTSYFLTDYEEAAEIYIREFEKSGSQT